MIRFRFHFEIGLLIFKTNLLFLTFFSPKNVRAFLMSVLKKITPILFLGIITRKSLQSAVCTSTTLNSLLQPFRMASTSVPYISGSSSICYITTPNEESAKKLARDVISNKLAACVNIIPNIQSIYEWDGRINEDLEYLMMIKTTTENVNELSTFVRDNHPYSVAEVISVKIDNGNPPYLDWVIKSVKKPNTEN